MQDYRTEEEIVDSIKLWWQENGLSVVAGIALGLSLLFGWRAWQDYGEQQASIASASYQQMLNYFELKDNARASEEANKLLSEYEDTLYASLASLALAKQQVEAGQLATAKSHLQWVIDKKHSAELVELATFRLAQVHVAANEVESAQVLVNKPHSLALSALYDELKGDIAVLMNDKSAARGAYQAALASQEIRGEHKTLIQTKLDNLGLSVSNTVQAKVPKLPEPTPEKPQDELATPSTAASALNPETLAALKDALANSSTQEKPQEVPQIEPNDAIQSSTTGSEHSANASNEVHNHSTVLYTGENATPSTLNNRQDTRILINPGQN